MRPMTAAFVSPSPNTSPYWPDFRFEVHALGLVAVCYGLDSRCAYFGISFKLVFCFFMACFGLSMVTGWSVLLSDILMGSRMSKKTF